MLFLNADLDLHMTDRSMLLVAWYFPPDGGAGSQRPNSFARHLPDLGWNVSVLTRKANHPRSRLESRDDGLLEEIDPRVRVHRVREIGPMPGVFGRFEKNISSTAGPFCRQLCEQVAEHAPSVVVISMSPFVLSNAIPHLRDHSSVRIVLDLRDPWALDYWPTISRGTARAQRSLMIKTLTQVDGVILNTSEARKALFSELGSHLPKDFDQRTSVIENGFSAHDFLKPVSSISDQLLITHCGTFLCEQLGFRRSIARRMKDRLFLHSRGGIDRTGRSPHYLLEAAGLLKRTHPEIFADLRFKFIGHVDDSLRTCIARSPCPEKVELTGYQSHSEMIGNLRRSTALFLPCGQLDDSVRELITPGKTYECLASARPIVAALHPGDALDLINESGGNYPCRPCSTDSIASALRDLHSAWSAGALRDPIHRDPSFLNRFDRSHLAALMSDFMDKILELPRVGCVR